MSNSIDNLGFFLDVNNQRIEIPFSKGVTNEINSFVRENPFWTLVILVAVGYLINNSLQLK